MQHIWFDFTFMHTQIYTHQFIPVSPQLTVINVCVKMVRPLLAASLILT